MITGLSSHTHPLEYTRRIRRCTYRTRSAETVVLTVSEISNTAESVALDDTLETLTFRGSDDIDKLAFLEYIDSQYFTIFLLVALLKTSKLGEVALRRRASLGKMASHGLGNARLLLLAKGKLNSLIAILLDGSHLCHYTRTSFNHCARYLLTVGIKKTGHSNFLS